MSAYVIDWLQLFFRWFHVIAGIAWIGASFYFVWLDNSLREPPAWKKDKGIKGDLWAIHGGGFYEVAKYQLGPEKMPETLHWFKWEAYTTWLTGMLLFGLIYYLGADAYLIDTAKVAWSKGEAIGVSLAGVLIGFAVYEILVRTPLRHHGLVFGLLLFVLLTAYAWLMSQWFADRAAYLQVGALIGSIMAGNVFLGIMPAQRGLVQAVQSGRQPDPQLGAFAKLRSTHNNYFTLPIIFIMISNHYPMTYGHEQNWLVLAAIGGISAFARHFFNLRHQGKFRPGILVISLAALLGLAAWMTPRQAEVSGAEALTRDQAMALVEVHCGSCHAAVPANPAFSAAPAGVVLDSEESLRRQAARVIPAVRSGYMPLGNARGMTEEERRRLVEWLAGEI